MSLTPLWPVFPSGRASYTRKQLSQPGAGDSRIAVEELQSALAIYPNFPLALNELGVQFLRLGQPDKAAQALAGAVKLAPEDFMPRLNYGFALLNQKKFAEAEEQFRVAVKRSNSVATPHLYLGMTLAMQRKLDEAEKELQTAIIINAVKWVQHTGIWAQSIWKGASTSEPLMNSMYI